MHELSIAHGLVEAASEAAREAGAVKVNEVRVRIGALSGVVASALLFCYDIAAAGTPLQGARLLITELPVVVYCPHCEAEVELPSIQLFCCPVCDTPAAAIRQGREMEIESLEIEVP
ncbi:MAG: hydrogenase maturation nickel metallochaperone HypA [Bryobacterales bacterium]|nr:hydrogenase maturation nickel metallochaperone HypA [Bryobacterales bacterium]